MVYFDFGIFWPPGVVSSNMFRIGSMLDCQLLIVQLSFQLFLTITAYFDAGRFWPPGGACGNMLTEWLL